jgi:GAF domain-containing protein
MFKKIPTFYILLAALLITSAVPLGLLAFNTLRTTETQVESEQITQLAARAEAHASTIDEQLKSFANATKLAADQAHYLLQDPQAQMTPAEKDAVLQKYRRDANEVLGLDEWYRQTYLPGFGDNRMSNVFLNRDTPLTPELEYAIAVTEKLDPLFDAIHRSNIGTQWIYLTLAEGMMRLFPWQDNSGYPVDWKPQEVSFYTVAAPERNPISEAVWTAPYNDFAGAGLMVTSSVPIYVKDKLVGVMSHDFCIVDLTKQVLGFEVGERGLAFLLDKQGNIIAHRNYAPENTPLGEELDIKLAEQDPSMAPAVAAMLSNSRGVLRVTDQSGVEWVVVYTRIPTTRWSLGLMQPRSEIIQPVLAISRNVLAGTIGLVVLAVIVSIGLARWISQPMVSLSNAARGIEASVDAVEASVGADEGAVVGAADLSHISGTREVSNLVTVFSQMVAALQKRINELGSIYTMGQTITSALEYEQTLQAIIAAVRQVVEFDAAEVLIARGNELTVEARSSQGGFRDTTGRKHAIGQGLTGRIAQDKTFMLFPSVSPEAVRAQLGPDVDVGFVTEAMRDGVLSFLGIPLLIGERLIGVITLVHHEANHFTENDRRQLSRLAAQASIAIDNAIQVRQRESILKQQISELQIEIDEVKKARQVAEITETDYFRELSQKAQRLRKSR